MPEPYKGLRPYEESDQENFFGRDAERQILVDKILTHKLTFLFAASGVGKSSLLQAAVLPSLKRADRNNLDAVYYKDWVGDPILTLKHTLVEYLTERYQLAEVVDVQLPLRELLRDCTVFTSEPLVIILDQFEEFFNYQRYSQNFSLLIAQLAHAIHDNNTATAFVISMREDFALELDAFKESIPTFLIDNFYRLNRLSLDNARQAIAIPVERLGFEYEPGLLDELIQDLSRREQIERLGASTAAILELAAAVEPPNLQMICSQLWELDQHNPNRCLTRATYVSQGKASGLLTNYFLNKINECSPQEQRLASLAFNYLVNKHGTKMAYPLPDLALRLRVEESALGATLDKLEQARILRKQSRYQAALSEHTQEKMFWYELYHDIFSKSIYDWNERYKNRQRLKKLAQWTTGMALGVVLLWLGYDGWVNHTAVHVRLSVQAGLSDRIELYQGQVGSSDIFGQQGYRYETDYTRTDIEPDKLFTEQNLSEPASNIALIHRFPLAQRVEAYWEIGRMEKALTLARCSLLPHNQTLSEQLISSFTTFHSVESFELLKKLFKQENDNYLKEKLEEALKNFYAPLPLLLKAFEDENARIRGIAAIKLGQLGRVEVVQPLIGLLKDSDWDIRSGAAKVLGQLGDPRAVQPLLPLLEDSDSSVRNRAAEALGRLGDSQVLPSLLPLLKDSDSEVRWHAAEVLGQLGDSQVLPSLLPLLNDSYYEVRRSVVNALGQLGDPQVLPSLLPLLQDSESSVRSSVANALGQLGDPQAVPSLLPLLQDSNSNVRINVANVLGQLGAPPQVLPSLLPLLQDSAWEVRINVANALSQLGDPQAVPSLLPLLQDSESSVRSSAVKALGQLGDPQAVPSLLPLLQNSDFYIRNSAADALGQLGASQAVPSLLPLLQDSAWDIRFSAVWALSQLGASQAVPLLLPLLQDSESDIRSSAAKVLGQLGDPLAVPSLLPLLQDSAWDIRFSAVWALGRLGDSQVIPSLLPLLKDSDSDVRSSAAYALAQLGAPQALPPLLQLLNDRNQDVRKQAAYALIELGHPKAVVLFMSLLKNQTVEKAVIAESSELQSDKSALWQSFMTQLQSEPTWVKIKTINFINELPAGLGRTAQRQLHHLLADQEVTVRLQAMRILADSVAPDLPESALLLEKLTPFVLNQQENLTVRLFAIKALGQLQVNAEILIDLIKQEQGKTDRESLIYQAYHSLGQTDSPVAVKFLQEQLQQLAQKKQTWRRNRDQETQRTTLSPDEDTQSSTRDCPHQTGQTDDDKRWRYPHWETTLGYVISQLDPKSGIQLLSHHLFNVRQGAWLAFGTLADVELLKQLNKQRDASQFVIFVDAAYRALDKSLMTLGLKGTAQDLKALREWEPTISDSAVRKRVEWTILELDSQLQLRAQVGGLNKIERIAIPTLEHGNENGLLD